MLQEDMGDKSICNIYGSGIICGRNKDTLLREAVNDHQYCREAIGQGQLLNKIHADGMPWMFQYWEWL